MLRVVVPPAPIVEPSDISVDYEDDDALVLAAIAAATAALDGPEGLLWRSLGLQTLELSGSSFAGLRTYPTGIHLQCPPIVDVVSVKYLDDADIEQTVDPSVYRLAGRDVWLAPDQDWPEVGCFPDAVRIRYRAGYTGTTVAEGGTGNVPAPAKQAIILSARQLMSIAAENLFLSSEEVDGVGQRRYVVSDQASQVVKAACSSLLAGLKVYS